MEETALNEVIQTDLPAPNPTRKRRWPLRLAAFALAGSALFAAYWFTRPPELVWWRSPEIGASHRRVHVLVPFGWQVGSTSKGRKNNGDWTAEFEMVSVDRTPGILRGLFPVRREKATLGISVIKYREIDAYTFLQSSEVFSIDDVNRRHKATRMVHATKDGISAEIFYKRTNLLAFNRTYRKICNSLTIE